jgi:hypothetical protein
MINRLPEVCESPADVYDRVTEDRDGLFFGKTHAKKVSDSPDSNGSQLSSETRVSELKVLACAGVVSVLAMVGSYWFAQSSSERDIRVVKDLQEQLDECIGDIPAELIGTEAGESMRQVCVDSQLSNK